MYDTNDLFGAISFGGGGSSGSSGGSAGRRERRDTVGERAQRTQNQMNGVISGAMDGILGRSGDNPDMGAMSDAQRGQNSRPSFGSMLGNALGGSRRGGGGR